MHKLSSILPQTFRQSFAVIFENFSVTGRKVLQHWSCVIQTVAAIFGGGLVLGLLPNAVVFFVITARKGGML